MLGLREIPDAPSESILMMVPNALRSPSGNFISRYVEHLVAHRSALGSETVGHLHTTFAASAETLADAQHMYEAAIMMYFCGKKAVTVTCAPLSSAGKFTFPGNGYTVRYTSSWPLQLAKESEVYVLDAEYISTCHAVLITADKKVHLIKCLFPGEDMQSPIRLAELAYLAEKMPEKWRPCSSGLVWDILYVVPWKARDSFKAQPYVGTNSRLWESGQFIQQFVDGWKIS